jgi:hypothetical protein
MMPVIKNLFILFLVLVASLCYAQEKELFERLSSLSYTDQLPEKVLSSKTVVLIQTPLKRTRPEVRSDWTEIAEVAQPGFKKAGIDAVAYYYIDDLLSGSESYRSFLDAFDDRDLTHAAFLFFDGQSYKLILLKLTDRKFLIGVGQPAWKSEGTDLTNMFENLYRIAANSRLEKTNLLIIESPQYGEMITLIKGRRSEFYDLNFSSEKLAVLPFADTAEIAAVMSAYPYKWGFVDPNIEEKELRSKGYQYILYYTHATGKSVKEMLGYAKNDSETAYISEVVRNGASEISSYNINTPVYKFYVKHIFSQNVFIGKRWDAAPTWQKALDNYITNLRNELVRN